MIEEIKKYIDKKLSNNKNTENELCEKIKDRIQEIVNIMCDNKYDISILLENYSNDKKVIYCNFDRIGGWCYIIYFTLENHRTYFFPAIIIDFSNDEVIKYCEYVQRLCEYEFMKSALLQRRGYNYPSEYECWELVNTDYFKKH